MRAYYRQPLPEENPGTGRTCPFIASAAGIWMPPI